MIVLNPTAIAENQPRLSLPVVIASIVGVWLCYFVLQTIRANVVGLEMQEELLVRRALVAVIGMAVTLLLWFCLRLFEHRGLGLKICAALLLSLPAAVLIAQANQWAFAPVEAEVQKRMGEARGLAIRRDAAGNILIDVPGAQMPDEDAAPVQSYVIASAPTVADRWRQIFDIALGRYFLLLAWAALYLALLAGAQARVAERRAGQFREAAKASELRSLRYQVNPHFLFNTLNSLSALVMTGKEERAEQMIQTMSRFYRHSLADDPTGDVSLEDEIDLQELYLSIEAVRFPERLRVAIDCPEELRQYKVPGMILQPLVENSVKYGVSASARPVTITIAAREEYGRLVLTVSDDGPGVVQSPSRPGTTGMGIGLVNVRDRLIARFGQDASIVSGPADQGYETELRLPMVR